MYAETDSIVGRVIERVSLDDSREVVTFEFKDGTTQSYRAEGDCCSYSWIEHLETPNDISGATLLSVKDSDTIEQDHPEHDTERGGDEISVYNTKFITDRGTIVLEYRNSSNGYYGGYLVNA